jgi:hypothetical protein
MYDVHLSVMFVCHMFIVYVTCVFVCCIVVVIPPSCKSPIAILKYQSQNILS